MRNAANAVASQNMNVAPLLGSTRLSATHYANEMQNKFKGRFRKRGPRSLAGIARRKSMRSRCHSSIASVPGESGTHEAMTLFHSQSCIILCYNIRCMHAHLAELEFQVAIHKPHFVLLQESWLNKSYESICIAGYTVLSRRDRSETENRGGIISLVREDVRDCNLLMHSAVAERSWHYLHSTLGTYAICNWYRPGAATDDHISSLADELQSIKDEVVGIVIMGDLNVYMLDGFASRMAIRAKACY